MKYYKPQFKKVLYLNTAFNCTKTTNTAGKYTEFTWNFPEIVINEVGELQVGSVSSQGTASDTKIYTFRVKGLQYNSSCIYSSDSGYPIIFSLLLNNYNSTFRDDFGIYLMQQSFNSITIQVSDDITNRDSGIATSISFVLCLVINEFDPTISEIGNPYQDANQRQKLITSVP